GRCASASRARPFPDRVVAFLYTVTSLLCLRQTPGRRRRFRLFNREVSMGCSSTFRVLPFSVVRVVSALFFGAGAPQSIEVRGSAREGSIKGTVVDPLGARVAGAAVTLLDNSKSVGTTTSGGEGEFTFSGLGSGRYQIEAAAPGFQKRTMEAVFVGSGDRVAV